MEFAFIFLLGSLTLIAISLQRTYSNVPQKELKRRARAGDALASGLYRAAAYGHSLRAFMWTLVIILSALFFVFLSRSTEIWFGLLGSALIIWFGFLWLPAQNATKAGLWLATRFAPALAWVLQYLHPVIDKINGLIRKYRPIHFHTGLYDKDDLIDLFEQQIVQADNRIDVSTLEIASHVLYFGDKCVEDILTPRRVVKAVSVEETVGPILMTELHASGFSRFPVYDGKKDNIVGVLYLRDLVSAKTGGQIRKLMHNQVCYVHEDQHLPEALQAILKTHQHLFIVVNSFEEYVGVVTIEDIFEEIIGKQIMDEFDQYEDMRAVAGIHAKKAHDTNHIEQDTTEEAPEVIELAE